MAITMKKIFDAVAESRRWRIEAGKRLTNMTTGERREYLRRTTEAFFAGKKARRSPTLAHRLFFGLK